MTASTLADLGVSKGQNAPWTDKSPFALCYSCRMEEFMMDEEKDLLAPLNYWSARLAESGSQFDNANTLRIQLPVAAGRQLRNLAEAVSACEEIIQTFAGRVDPSKDALRQLAEHLRTIHRRLDDVVLPATITD